MLEDNAEESGEDDLIESVNVDLNNKSFKTEDIKICNHNKHDANEITKEKLDQLA